MDRDECLDTAKSLINGRRAVQYGDAYLMHQRVADLWNEYLEIPEGFKLNVKDVTCMMMLLKIARLRNSVSHDSFVDICGYAALGVEMTADEND